MVKWWPKEADDVLAPDWKHIFLSLSRALAVRGLRLLCIRPVHDASWNVPVTYWLIRARFGNQSDAPSAHPVSR